MVRVAWAPILLMAGRDGMSRFTLDDRSTQIGEDGILWRQPVDNAGHRTQGQTVNESGARSSV